MSRDASRKRKTMAEVDDKASCIINWELFTIHVLMKHEEDLVDAEWTLEGKSRMSN